MRKPQPMVRRFAIAMLLDNHGVIGLRECDVSDEWSEDFEAVQLTITATGKKMLWWPVAPELIDAAQRFADSDLLAWQQSPTNYQRVPS